MQRLVAQSSGSRMLTGAAAQTWIHLNAAGSSPASDASHAATICHLELEKEMGGYAAAAAAPADAHGAIARLLNCSAAEIALADSAQQAWARAFYSLNFRAGDRILCFENEYGGNAVAFLQAQQRCPGLDLEVLPMRSDGIIDVSALKTALFQTSGESAPSAAAPPLAPPLSRRERFEGESDSQGGASLAASLPNPAWLPVTVPPSSPSATSTVSTETTVAV